jgi:hypothetical protein
VHLQLSWKYLPVIGWIMAAFSGGSDRVAYLFCLNWQGKGVAIF